MGPVGRKDSWAKAQRWAKLVPWRISKCFSRTGAQLFSQPGGLLLSPHVPLGHLQGPVLGVRDQMT